MYPYRLARGVPYWNGATHRAILRSIVSCRMAEGPALDKLRTSIIERLGVESALLCGSGSLALEIALRACGVGQGDEVVVPTFCCTAVVPPILAAGALPVLADVGEELNATPESIESSLTTRTKAVIVPHLFGNPADIDPIVDLARGRGIPVIDDAAQALGATIEGRPVGSLGDAGILSFGSEKICCGLGGGVAISRKEDFFAGHGGHRLPPARLFPSTRSLMSTILWRRWRRWTWPVQAAFARTTDPNAPPIAYRTEGMANLKAAVALPLVQTLHENIAARRARVRAYRELLGPEDRLELIPHRSGSACLAQVVRLVAKHRGDDPAARLIETLSRAGYEVQGSYVPIHLLPRYEKWSRSPLRHAERVWSDLIELPCEPNMRLDDVERIAAVVKRTVRA